jgi:protoheme IX farnesyltransferase
MQTLTDIADADPVTLTTATPRARAWWVDWYELTKPRMNFLVVVTTMVGYYMATRAVDDWARVLATLIGTALTAAGSSVFNQYSERGYDALMPRTAGRPLPAGRVAPAEALTWGIALSVLGVLTLALFVNPLTAFLGAFTLATYVFVYTPAKRWTTLCTVIGAVPGAIPPMMGVTAVEGKITPAALVLFTILFFWQMPHFLAIAILYRDDYAKGGFKMLPVVDEGMRTTGTQMVLYALALLPVTLVPAMIGMAGAAYFLEALVLGLVFCSFAILCATRKRRSDARQLFLASIVYLPALMAALMINKL